MNAAYPPLVWLELGKWQTYVAVRRTGGPLDAGQSWGAKMASVWALRLSRLLVALHSSIVARRDGTVTRARSVSDAY